MRLRHGEQVLRSGSIGQRPAAYRGDLSEGRNPEYTQIHLGLSIGKRVPAQRLKPIPRCAVNFRHTTRRDQFPNAQYSHCDSETEFFRLNRFYGRPDFLLLAGRFGIHPDIATEVIDMFSKNTSKVEILVQNSLLPEPITHDYLARMVDRLLA